MNTIAEIDRLLWQGFSNYLKFIMRIEQANRLNTGDCIDQLLAGNIYESIRKFCRENPDTTQELQKQLPRGYQLIPPKLTSQPVEWAEVEAMGPSNEKLLAMCPQRPPKPEPPRAELWLLHKHVGYINHDGSHEILPEYRAWVRRNWIFTGIAIAVVLIMAVWMVL